VIALSWSRLSDFMSCKLKFKLKYIDKAFPKEDAEKSIHLVKGEQFHKQLEDYVLAKNGLQPMPLGFSPEIKATLPYVDKLYSVFAQVHPEAQVASTVEWKPTEWFGKDAAWRAIWDVIGLRQEACFIGDYKSGKIYDYGSGYGQLHLSAVIASERFPWAEEIRTAYIYIEHKHIYPVNIKRADMPVVKQYFDDKFGEVQEEKEFAPTKNDYCKYCPATMRQCKFSRKL
jgi:CRISPR/Cas system-associated exonuclease Cas4 (RecB family)